MTVPQRTRRTTQLGESPAQTVGRRIEQGSRRVGGKDVFGRRSLKDALQFGIRAVLKQPLDVWFQLHTLLLRYPLDARINRVLTVNDEDILMQLTTERVKGFWRPHCRDW